MTATLSPHAIANDPRAFRDSLIVDVGEPKLFGECLDDWQDADFRAMDPAWCDLIGAPVPEGPVHRRGYLERCRGASKTLDLGVQALWAVLFSRRRLLGVCAAVDKDQAKLLLDSIEGIVRLNPWMSQKSRKQDGKFEPPLTITADRVVNTYNGSELRVLASDSASSYGITPDFLIVDEITHFAHRRLWDSLLSSAAKRPRCLVLVISNAGVGKGESWQWKLREYARQSDDWYFSRLDGKPSWIDEDQIVEQEKLLPGPAFRRLWLNQWSVAEGDAIDEELLTEAIKHQGPMRGNEEGWRFAGGVDLGTRHDCTGIAVVGKSVGGWKVVKGDEPPRLSTLAALVDCGVIEPADDERVERIEGSGALRLAHAEKHRPQGKRIDLGMIEERILALDGRFKPDHWLLDAWQGELLASRLQAQGVPVELLHFSQTKHTDMAQAILNGFRDKQVELFDDPSLMHDLRAARIEERGVANWRVVFPRDREHGHGDVGTAFGLGLLAAKNLSGSSMPPVTTRPLVLSSPGGS